MTKQTEEALKIAIEQMQHLIKIYIPSPEWSGTAIQEDCYAVIQACKEALEQPAQEPDYWLGYGLQAHDEKPFEGATPLYTHPAPSWQGLSDDELNKIIEKHKLMWVTVDFARAIEQALMEKNNGTA